MIREGCVDIIRCVAVAVLRCDVYRVLTCVQVLSALQAALPSYKGNVTLAASADSCCSSQAILVCPPSAKRQD